MRPLSELATALAERTVSARELIEHCLARIADPCGEGARTFLRRFAAGARAHANAVDQLRAAGARLPPLAGIPVSVKDLFDIAGEVTTAGSVVLAAEPPAARDARCVERLRAAGLIVIGRTNMTELAYSGLGINPHFGTPLNPHQRVRGRIPGGSSSGAAVSVTDGMAAAALGTDTGGSCRIPAALCGLVGFKPTAQRVPRDGVLALSTTLDSVGPLAPTVACCALIDAVLSGEEPRVPDAFPLRGARLLALSSYALEGLEPYVADCYERALGALSGAGALIASAPLPELARLPEINAKGGFSAAESYARYGALVRARRAQFDPRVVMRIEKGAEQSAADYLELVRARAELIVRIAGRTAAFDAVVMPTAPCVAPLLADLASEEAYLRMNGLVLRNPAIANFLDRCAISIPVHRAGEAPVGLTLMGEHAGDARLLALARGAESVLSAGIVVV